MKKKLLILGAGIYQVPLIKRARKMGLHTIAASYPGPYPGLSLADQAWPIDTRDAESLFQAAEREGIDGVCTSGTDVAISSMGVLCSRLSLPGIPLKAARLLTDKYLMKEAFVRGGVQTPRAVRVSSAEEAVSAFYELSAPVMVKAVDSSGSRGVTRADSEAQLLRAYQSARQVTKKDYVLVEEFVAAHEIGVDGFLSQGRPALLLPHDKFVYRTANGACLPEGHRFPYECPPRVQEDIRTQILAAVQAVGMDQGAFNADVLITEEGKALILEMGGRAGATCIPELISLYLGCDYYEQIIRCALGLPVDFSHGDVRPAMAKLLFTPKSGILSHVDLAFLEGLRSQGVQVSLDYKTGDLLPAVCDGTDRIGQVIMATDQVSRLEETLSQIRGHLKIDGETLEQLWNE